MQTGDLAFSFIGKEGNAISAVTEGYRGARVNHMGVVIANGDGVFVLEAFYPEVCLTRIEDFQLRSNDTAGKPRLMFGRLQQSHRKLIDPAIQYGLAKVDIPYDPLYMTDEAALYCSELVIDMFKHANGGIPFFVEKPMSFRDTKTGLLLESWIDYYAHFGRQVPQGEPGSNPGDISRDSRVDIYQFTDNIPGLR